MSKLSFYTAFLVFTTVNVFSQEIRPVVKKEKLKDIQFISQISPKLWQQLYLPYKERSALDQLSRIAYSESFINPNTYNAIVEYMYVEIEATCYGKKLKAQSVADALTEEQRNILSAVDMGSDIMVKIGFKYKDKTKGEALSDGIIEGQLAITAVPETEAEFPGGYLQVQEYLKKNVTTKTHHKNTLGKLEQASVKFTVDENGKITNAKINRTSKDPMIDKLLLEATTNMPKWKPAKNSKGITVKQEFHVLLGGGC